MIELHNGKVPPAERFGWWCELTARQMFPTVISSDRADDFRASVTILPLGPVTVTSPRFVGMTAARTPVLIRRSDPELWTLTLVRGGSMWIEQNRSRARLTPGDLVLHDTSRPLHCGIEARHGSAHTIALQLPRRNLPLPERLLRDQVARPLPTARGSGALLGRFMTGLLREATTLGPAERDRLGAAAIDLMTAFFSAAAGPGWPPPAQTRRELLLRQVKAFVQHHLDEASLSPSAIAAAHHVSVRYLHYLFEQEEQTIGEYIRRQRLERCRADLTDSRLLGRSVSEIARRWGFPDPSSFNRAFRAAYGLPPGEYRKGHGGNLPARSATRPGPAP